MNKEERGKRKGERGIIERRALSLMGLTFVMPLLSISISIWVALSGCSEKAFEPERATHPAGWGDSVSPDFHGKALAQRTPAGYATCRSCHGADTTTAATGFACYSCHDQFPHPSGWSGPDTTNLHGKAVRRANWDATSCRNCHGADSTGGPVGPACFSCHDQFPHPVGWSGPDTTNLHGKAARRANWDAASCRNCHGADSEGGSTGFACFSCHDQFPHPSGWSNPGAASFHGEAVRQANGDAASCRNCHGADSDGSATGFACFSCHDQFPHPSGWSGEGTANMHQTAIQQADWNIATCKACHGADYRTPKPVSGQDVTCYTCHTGDSGPEGCRVCHGGPNSTAPPPDLLGNSATTIVTVGAHQAHLDGSRLSDGIACSECHAIPASFDAPGHIDPTSPRVAEVVFGTLAGDSGQTSPQWDRTTGSCSAVYCHGSFDGGNDTLVVNWTAGRSQAQCGSCHSLPPPTLPHTQAGSCAICHVYSRVNHINGRVD